MNSTRSLKGLPLALLFVSAHSQAALLLSENFSSYTAGSINGQAVASPNASGIWDASSNTYGDFTVGSGRLDYSRSVASTAGVPKYAGFNIADTTATNTTSTEYWASGSLSTGSLQGAFFATRLFATTANYIGGDFVDHMVFGIENGKAFLGNYYPSFSNGSGAVTLSKVGESTATFDGGEHNLLVQLMNNGTSDIYQMWVDPDLSGGMAGLGTADVVAPAANRIHETGSKIYDSTNPQQTRFAVINAGSTPTQSAWFDDYRLGTSFAEVTVPEPSAAMLSLAGMMGLLGMRRRA